MPSQRAATSTMSEAKCRTGDGHDGVGGRAHSCNRRQGYAAAEGRRRSALSRRCHSQVGCSHRICRGQGGWGEEGLSIWLGKEPERKRAREGGVGGAEAAGVDWHRWTPAPE
ncbi:hypothetical protein BRADI_1g65693v3 [Brachypodium distachyon]|uniref:Uncharacterized protein n=1 Tax=Brachypodium distachyon TaxID=15368 RepID=A0A0Q3LGJ5_BRADI|nr:hypothetical protein BRADI_1g65693v3 [Brachypodium distachyon]